MRRLLEHVLGPPLAAESDHSRIYRPRGRCSGPWALIYRPFTHPLPFIGAQVDEAEPGWGYAVSGGVGLGGDRPGIAAVIGWRRIPWDRALEPLIGRGWAGDRLAINVLRQSPGAPVIDSARGTHVRESDGATATSFGVAIRIPPTAGPAVYVGVLGLRRSLHMHGWWPAALFGGRGDRV